MSPGRAFRPLHIDRSGEFVLPLPLGHAFPLFSPEGERAWIPTWDPEYLHPDHPSNAPGTLFEPPMAAKKRFGCADLQSERSHRAVRPLLPASRVGTVQAHCHEEAPARTRVSVSYSLTAITPAGNAVLAALTPEKYAMLHDWQDAITTSQLPSRG